MYSGGCIVYFLRLLSQKFELVSLHRNICIDLYWHFSTIKCRSKHAQLFICLILFIVCWWQDQEDQITNSDEQVWGHYIIIIMKLSISLVSPTEVTVQKYINTVSLERAYTSFLQSTQSIWTSASMKAVLSSTSFNSLCIKVRKKEKIKQPKQKPFATGNSIETCLNKSQTNNNCMLFIRSFLSAATRFDS